MHHTTTTTQEDTMSDTQTTTRLPGMYDATGRCLTCDGRYCGTDCDARPGYVWVVGIGWRSEVAATTWEMQGRTVYWDDRAERFLP